MRSRKSIDVELLNGGFRYALSLCANRQDAEDIVHDAWIRLDRRYRGTPNKALLFQTIRNLYIDQYRRAKRVQFREFDEGHYVKEVAVDRLTTEEMNDFLSELRDIEREALYLSVVEGYTADEISRMTGSARGSVLSLVHRSKIKLRTLMVGANIDGEGITSAEVVSLHKKRQIDE